MRNLLQKPLGLMLLKDLSHAKSFTASAILMPEGFSLEPVQASHNQLYHHNHQENQD